MKHFYSAIDERFRNRNCNGESVRWARASPELINDRTRKSISATNNTCSRSLHATFVYISQDESGLPHLRSKGRHISLYTVIDCDTGKQLMMDRESSELGWNTRLHVSHIG